MQANCGVPVNERADELEGIGVGLVSTPQSLQNFSEVRTLMGQSVHKRRLEAVGLRLKSSVDLAEVRRPEFPVLEHDTAN